MLDALHSFAANNSSSNTDNFDRFIAWVNRAQPEVLVDGSNVGLFKQNYAGGGFNFPQISSVLKKLKRQCSPTTQPVLCMHAGRLKSPEAQDDFSQQLISQLQAKHALCVTPRGSNDDWYWLYAAIAARRNGYAVTNDELRDHIAHLMPNPAAFLRWQELHQVHFSLSAKKTATIHWPEPFTTTVQHDPENKWWWLFPVAEQPKGGTEPKEDSGKGLHRQWLAAWSPSLATAKAAK